ncbi:MAG: desulfoferrodoxin [Victivallales bacterium]|nr:desulfoferrodoxin [Victivallales bacterium]
MPARTKVYKCSKSAFTVEVTNEAAECAAPVCCGEPMQLMQEQTADKTKEKHVPLLSGNGNGTKVVVGCTPHPMTEEHYIEWIEVINGSYVNRKYLRPGDAPEAEFYVPLQENLIVRSYCNKHGLWRG